MYLYNYNYNIIHIWIFVIILLSLVEPDILKQSKFTDHEINIIKDIALEKIHRQRIVKEIKAMDLLEKQFSD